MKITYSVILFFMFQSLVLFLLCHIRTIETLECYYCHDEEGYYCPRPFPLKSMYKTEEKYREQLTNIAIISSNEQSNVAVISCFKIDYFNSNYQYQNSYRGGIKSSMNNSITCQSNYRLSQNPNYPGWEKTFCCYDNRCNQATNINNLHPFFLVKYDILANLLLVFLTSLHYIIHT